MAGVRREAYLVEVTRPEGVSVKEMKAYVKEAVETWGGQYHPEDPMFYGQAPVRVKRQKPNKLENN